jgi:predicted permease
MQLSLGVGRYPDSLQFAFYRDLMTRLAARPGIQSAAAINVPPLTGGGIVTGVRIMGMPPTTDGSPLMSAVTAITPAYFQTMGVRLLRGRDVAWTDAAPTLVVSESAARRFWPNMDPIGRRIGFGTRDTLGLEVVGVVSDVRIRNLMSDPDPLIYMLLSGATTIVRRTTLLVRGAGDVAAITGTTKNVLHELDPTLPLFNIQPMTDIVAQSVAQPKLNSTLLAIFAALALLLATVGIYGVVSYSVAQRTHEMGLRMALGAPRSNVLRLVVKEGVLLASAGVVIGLLVSRVATSVIASWLYDITPGDPLTYAAVGLLLVAIALLASYLPARRATRVDPVIAMRAE